MSTNTFSDLLTECCATAFLTDKEQVFVQLVNRYYDKAPAHLIERRKEIIKKGKHLCGKYMAEQLVKLNLSELFMRNSGLEAGGEFFIPIMYSESSGD